MDQLRRIPVLTLSMKSRDQKYNQDAYQCHAGSLVGVVATGLRALERLSGVGRSSDVSSAVLARGWWLSFPASAYRMEV